MNTFYDIGPEHVLDDQNLWHDYKFSEVVLRDPPWPDLNSRGMCGLISD